MAVSWVLMMEAARTSETMVNFYQIKRHYNPEDKPYLTQIMFLLPPECLSNLYDFDIKFNSISVYGAASRHSHLKFIYPPVCNLVSRTVNISVYATITLILSTPDFI
jgi:hypothetical protein